jgi:predicted nucleic acid-binding protein
MRNFVLDASAAIDFAQGGSGANKMEQLLADAVRQQLGLYISVLHLAELFYLTWHKTGEQRAREIIASFSRLPVQIIDVSLPQALKAGELKARHRISFVDCVAAALTLQQHATLVTADRDFEKLGRHFPILWLTRP